MEDESTASWTGEKSIRSEKFPFIIKYMDLMIESFVTT